MLNIRVSELFYSLQGEGKWVGAPSVFLRTFGCNFTCSGFGCPPGVKSTEADDIAKHIQMYDSVASLPLARTGCDSYMSWHPAYKHLSPFKTTDQLVQEMLQLTPNHQWVQNNGNDVHLVITGGEPLLWQKAIIDLLSHSEMQDLCNITFETNGTQPLSSNTVDFMRSLGCEVTFSVSAKLSSSGEQKEDAIKPEIVASYQNVGPTYLKFVVETEQHVNEIVQYVDEYRAAGFRGSVYLMPVGGVTSSYKDNAQKIADIALERGFFYSPRLHVDIWGNSWGK